MVDHVYVDGDLVVDRGPVTRVDEAALFAEANELLTTTLRSKPSGHSA